MERYLIISINFKKQNKGQDTTENSVVSFNKDKLKCCIVKHEDFNL